MALRIHVRLLYKYIYKLYGDVPSDGRDGRVPLLLGRLRTGSVPIPLFHCRPPFASFLRQLVNPIQLHLQVKSNPAAGRPPALMMPLLLSKLVGAARPTRTVGPADSDASGCRLRARAAGEAGTAPFTFTHRFSPAGTASVWPVCDFGLVYSLSQMFDINIKY